MIWVKLIFDGKEVEDTAGVNDIKEIERLYREHFGERFGGIVDWGKLTKEQIEKRLNKNNFDYDEYTPSATRGDYSPSNPWDAEGMSVSDFI